MHRKLSLVGIIVLLCVSCGTTTAPRTQTDVTAPTATAPTTELTPTVILQADTINQPVTGDTIDEEEGNSGNATMNSVSADQGNLYGITTDGGFYTNDNPEVPALLPGKIIATTSFLPQVDGFSFANYGNDGAANLQSADMYRIFGEQVCARMSSGRCVLTPNAKAWMEKTNREMSGGHCYGFALLSELFYLNRIDRTQFGANQTFDLAFNDNKVLQREIAIWMANQFTEPQDPTKYQDEIQQYGWGSNGVTATPMQLVSRLVDDFTKLANGDASGDLYVLAIFQPEYKDGHAIMPFAVKQNDNGTVSIMVYDNNFPAQAREVVIDPNTNEWSYDTSINPSEPVQPYQGNAETFTMFLSRVSHTQDLPRRCDFCGEGDAGTDAAATSKKTGSQITAYNELSLYGNVDMLIVDANGKRAGFVGGKLINEIPGVQYQPTVSANLWEDDPSSNWKIPQNMDFSVQLSGEQLSADETSDIMLIGPGYSLAVEELIFSPGQKDTIAFTGDGRKISYDTNAADTPYLTLIYETPQNDYLFEVQVYGDKDGQNVQLLLDPTKQQFAVTTIGRDDTASYTLYMARYSDTDTEEFDTAYSLEKGVTDYIAYGAWKGNGTPLTIGTDLDGDGVIDETANAADVSN